MTGDVPENGNPEPCAAGVCPLCRRVNDCRQCVVETYKGPCWCERVEMPAELLARVPAELRNRACICAVCVSEFRRAQRWLPRAVTGEFYFEDGRMVFTEAYHLRRGYCCGSGCRHCPYDEAGRPRQEAVAKASVGKP
jgi:hypothetical protein